MCGGCDFQHVDLAAQRRLKARLLFTPGVMVTSVPYVLQSGRNAGERMEADDASGSVRRNIRSS